MLYSRSLDTRQMEKAVLIAILWGSGIILACGYVMVEAWIEGFTKEF